MPGKAKGHARPYMARAEGKELLFAKSKDDARGEFVIILVTFG